MITMESSNPSKDPENIYDPIRKRWLKALPEEQVRQAFLLHLLKNKGFPKDLISLEIGLSQLPHISHKQSLPQRRIDIVAYAKDLSFSHPLYPLILIECKDKDFNHKALGQLQGYNTFIESPYICLVNKSSLLCGVYDLAAKKYEYLDHLPTYQQLYEFALERGFGSN